MGTNDMDKFTTITVEARDAIEILSLNRPDALNAVTPAMADELIAYFSGLHDRLSTRIVIFRGNGRAFCAGAELGSDAFAAPGAGRPQRQLDMQQRYSRIIRLMRSCPQPIVALVQGAACGAGFSLLLASDVRFATAAATWDPAICCRG
jgi:enoyl-CoA hydratase/carnithine racemase